MRSLCEISARSHTIEELADWVEISCFFRADRSVSKEDLVRSLVREGGNRFERTAREKATSAFDELETRSDSIGNTIGCSPIAVYPFDVDGDVLRLKVDPFADERAGLLYVFLLAVTRASMEASTRRLKRIDPTHLFEEVCADSLCQFWGGKSALADVLVAGTSNRGAATVGRRFPIIVDTLAGHLKEGGGWKPGARSPGAGDGGLDLAVWRRFHDGRPGSLVGFAQCKTGDHWQDHLGTKNPLSFCHKYFQRPLVITPMPIYMVPCRVSVEEWSDVIRRHSGILFDRCRIANYGTHISPETTEKCAAWTVAAIEREMNDLIERGLVRATPVIGATT